MLVEDYTLWAGYLEEQEAAALLGFTDSGAPTGASPVTFPDVPLRVLVELLINNVWTDVSQYVMYQQRIVITRGRRGSQRRSSPATCALTLDNQDRRFSPHNVTGPYYPYLRSGVKLRVQVDAGTGMHVRYTGRVSGWRPEVRGHTDDRFTPVVAYGVRSRLERGEQPLRSALYRAIGMEAEMVRYWPCEDGADAGSLASAVTGGPAAATTAVTYASESGLTGSAPLPRLDGATSGVFCPIWWPAPNGRWQFDWHYHLPEVPAADTVVVQIHGSGTVVRWEWVTNAGATNITIRGYDSVGATVVNVTNGVAAADVTNLWAHWSLYLQQNGGNVDWGWKLFPSLGGGGLTTSGSYAGTVGGLVAWQVPASAGVTGMAFGHEVIYDAYNHTQPGRPAFGWAGSTASGKELATDRFARLCAEEDVDHVVAEQLVDTEHMGPQRLATLSDLLRECEDVSEGLIDETVHDELRLISRTYRWNREIAMTIDFSQRLLQPPFVPAVDDEWLRNDWSISRTGGSSARFQRTSGPLNVSEPEDDPEGVGRAADSATVNVHHDEQALAHAAYRVGRDTVDEPRLPQVKINFAQAPSLIEQWLRCDISSRVTVRHGVSWSSSNMYDVSPVDVDQTLECYVETITQVSWEADLALEPYEVNNVGTYSGGSRYDCPATTLAAALVAESSFPADFEGGVSGWVPTDATFTSSGAVARSGSLSGLLTVVGSPVQAYARYEWPVTAGQSYRASVWCYRAAGYSDVSCAIDWFDSTHAYISTTNPGGSALAAAVWEERAASGQAPAGAAYAQVGPTLGGTPTGVSMHVDDASFCSQVSVSITDTCAWAHDDGDYEVVVGGEVMRVAAVGAVGGTYPSRTQTLSVFRAVNGVVKAHSAGSRLGLAEPAYWAL